MKLRLVLAAALGAAILLPPMEAASWGATGHRLVGMAAVRALPDELPAFLRTPQAAAEIGELSREPDRWKGAGQPHDRMRDAAHFVDMLDDGRVMVAGGPHIREIPEHKWQYDAALLRAGTDVNTAGFLPYAMMDAWQQLVRDFAYIRVLNAAAARETDPGRAAWYREDIRRREALTLRDLGELSHYVADGSQPHHTTIHFNGWDRDTPNPEGFTTSRQTHGMFEGAFVQRTQRLDVIEAAMPAPRLDDHDMRGRTTDYLLTTLVEVTPFYRLEKVGGFRDDDPRGVAFATERLAAAAAELRDLTILAWRASADASVGWPAVKVSEVEAGAVDPWLSMIGED